MTASSYLNDLYQLSAQHFNQGDFAEAAKLYGGIARYYENHPSEFSQETKASLFNDYGLALKRSGNLILAEKTYLKVNEWSNFKNPCYLNNLAVCYFEMGAYSLSRYYYQKSIDILKVLGNDPISLALFQSNLGTLFAYKGAFQKAKGCLIDSLETFQNFGSQNNIAHTQFRLGHLVYTMGYFSEAVKFLKTSINAKASFYGHIHPRTVEVILVLAEVYLAQRDFQKATSLTSNVLSIFQKTLDPHAPQTGRCYLLLAEIESLRGIIHNNTKANLRKAYLIFKRSYPHGMNPDMAHYYALRGSILIYEKNYHKALIYLNKALQIRQGLFESIHPLLAMNYNEIGYCHVQLKQHSQAKKAYLKSLHIFKRIHRQHPWLPFLLRNIVDLYHSKLVRNICLDYGQKISKVHPSLINDATIENESQMDVLLPLKSIRPEIEIVLIATADMGHIARQLQAKIDVMVDYYKASLPTLHLSAYIEHDTTDVDNSFFKMIKEGIGSPYLKTFICLVGKEYGHPAQLPAELLKKNPWMTNFRDRAAWEMVLRDCIYCHAAGTLYHYHKRVSRMDIQNPYLRTQALIQEFESRKAALQIEVKAISETDLHAADLIMHRLNLPVLRAMRQFKNGQSNISV